MRHAIEVRKFSLSYNMLRVFVWFFFFGGGLCE